MEAINSFLPSYSIGDGHRNGLGMVGRMLIGPLPPSIHQSVSGHRWGIVLNILILNGKGIWEHRKLCKGKNGNIIVDKGK